MVQLHDIKPKTKNKTKKRIGRGGKRGTYSGRGQKGQKSRAGRKLRPQMRDIIKKIPKKRGYRFQLPKSFDAIINLGVIEGKFEAGEKITVKTLLEKGLVKKTKGKLPRVKILAQGELTKKLNFSDCSFSRPAEEKIKKAGGKII